MKGSLIPGPSNNGQFDSVYRGVHPLQDLLRLNFDTSSESLWLPVLPPPYVFFSPLDLKIQSDLQIESMYKVGLAQVVE